MSSEKNLMVSEDILVSSKENLRVDDIRKMNTDNNLTDTDFSKIITDFIWIITDIILISLEVIFVGSGIRERI